MFLKILITALLCHHLSIFVEYLIRKIFLNEQKLVFVWQTLHNNRMGLADWKKKFMDMNTGVSKITIAEELSQNCIQKNVTLAKPVSIDDRLIRILNVKTLGSEVGDVLKPKMQTFTNMTPMDYQSKLNELINYLQELKKHEKRAVVKPIYQDAIRVLQAETISAGLLEEFRIMLLQG